MIICNITRKIKIIYFLTALYSCSNIELGLHVEVVVAEQGNRDQ